METLNIDSRAVAFHRRGDPDAERTALCLHGFPDEAGAWSPVAERLAAAGWRVFVPQMPGYGASTPLASPAPHRLAAHFEAFLAALDVPAVYVLGHDWGAVAGYALANRAPDRVVALAALSVPPPAVFAANLLRHPRQLVRSRYMAQFQVPGLSERFVGRDHHAFVEVLWRRWSPGFDPPPERLAAVREALATPTSLRAALDYYRALRDPRAWLEGREQVFRRIVVPTLVLAGARDECIAPPLYDGLARAFLGPFDFALVPGAGHFLPVEAPGEVVDRALTFFAAHAGA